MSAVATPATSTKTYAPWLVQLEKSLLNKDPVIQSAPWYVKLGHKLTLGRWNQTLVVSFIMIFRPMMILLDPAVSYAQKRYAATREFFTELIGMPAQIATAFVLEKYLPKLADSRFDDYMRIILTKADWASIPILGQRLKGLIQFGSTLGVAIGAGVFTPLINNLVINKAVLDKINSWLDPLLGQSNEAISAEGKSSSPDLARLLSELSKPLPSTPLPASPYATTPQSPYPPPVSPYASVQPGYGMPSTWPTPGMYTGNPYAF
jgi:hypothetical protein